MSMKLSLVKEYTSEGYRCVKFSVEMDKETMIKSLSGDSWEVDGYIVKIPEHQILKYLINGNYGIKEFTCVVIED